MRFEAFVPLAKDLPVFDVSLLQTSGLDKAYAALVLHRWENKGLVVRLKRGLYTLTNERRTQPISVPWLANTLYSPSYLSLEFMLSWYDLIPEQTRLATSVTRLKTAEFKNHFGTFSYRNLQKKFFFGMTEILDNNTSILVATPEKALIDTIYFSKSFDPSPDFFLQNLRLQSLEQLSKKRLRDIAKKMRSKKINLAVDVLITLF